MKKNWIKKLVVVVVLVVALVAGYLVVKMRNGFQLPMTEAKKSTSYLTLKTAVENFSTSQENNGKVATEVYSYDKSNSVYNFDRSGLTKSQIRQVKESLSGEEVNGAQYFYGYSNDNTGYYIEKYYDQKSDKYKPKIIDLTKTDGTKYTNYLYEYNTDMVDPSESKEMSLVDQGYAGHNYRLSVDSLSTDGVLAEYEALFNYIKNCGSYDEFKTSLNDYMKDAYASFGADGGIVSEGGLSVDISRMLGGTYVLTINIAFTAQDVDLLLLSLDELTVTSTVKITFNNDMIEKIEIKTSNNGVSELPTNIALWTSEYGEEDVIIVNFDQQIEEKVVFDAEFSTSAMNTDVSDYEGRGIDGEAISKEITVTYRDLAKLNGMTMVYGNCGSPVRLDIVELEHAIVEYYWDKEKTKKVQATDVYPGNDVEIYYTVELEEGYAIVNEDGDIVVDFELSDQVISTATPYRYYYLDSTRYEILEIKVNGVVVEPENYEAGLILEDGKTYNITYKLKYK